MVKKSATDKIARLDKFYQNTNEILSILAT